MATQNRNPRNTHQKTQPAPRISIFKLLEAQPKARLETLSDGIFAVAMTLLALDIKLPPLPQEVTPALLSSALFDLWPKVGAFIISFFFLAKTWDVHRLIFYSLERVDYTIFVENLLLLLFACGLPFSSSLISAHLHAGVAAAIYLGNMIALPLLNYAMWDHATRGYRLVSKDISPTLVEWFNRNHQLVIAVYLVAFPIAYFSSELSVLWIFLFQIVMHILPFISKDLVGSS
jgi:uncharacterized membrane protein